MPEFERILSIVEEIATAKPDAGMNSMPLSIIIEAEDILNVCRTLHQHSETYFDMLSCLTAIDNGPETGTMEVIYNLYSIPYNYPLMLKVLLPRENPEVDTVSTIWKTAGWHEREAYDLYGIKFKDHPDLRRILLPADWEGFPLRKDYNHQQYYRGVKVEY
jgi:NADH-quinone oxidoreductase subunit C